MDEDARPNFRAEAGNSHSRPRRSGREARSFGHRVYEEVHRRLGQECGVIEKRGGNAREGGAAVSGAGDGIYAERPGRRVFSSSRSKQLTSAAEDTSAE